MFSKTQLSNSKPVTGEIKCTHCGDPCTGFDILYHDKHFCCEGCKLVYEIICENNLGYYYNLNTAPGTKFQEKQNTKGYVFLDDPEVISKLISFTDGSQTHIKLSIPQIHCSSCIWLLENLYKFDKGITQVSVNFLERTIHVVYQEQETSLRKIAGLLERIGYAPHFSFNDLAHKTTNPVNRDLYYRLGVAFFCFGNIMLLSFPEYFGLEHLSDGKFKNLFGLLNIGLSLPVLLYADSIFFKSAWNALKQMKMNMDVPIALGILAMFIRSLLDIVSGTGSGYMDTFAGLVFFMLAGRLFQSKSYKRLSFDRDYKSYFPVSVTVNIDGSEVSRPLNTIKPGDRLIIHNNEIIPADGILISGIAGIDYSFVTGENLPVSVSGGQTIYAGGKQNGPAITVEVIRSVEQSRLTELWNQQNPDQLTDNITSLSDRVSRFFTPVIILLAVVSASWYMFKGDFNLGFNVFTAVLIITCPCALALSYPFAMGSAIRIFGLNGLYIKNIFVIEKMASVTNIVFDKTGTLTETNAAQILYAGTSPDNDEIIALRSIIANSFHPLSRLISRFLGPGEKVPVFDFNEIPGRGVTATVNDCRYVVGSADFVTPGTDGQNPLNTSVSWSVNGVYRGSYLISNKYRSGIGNVIALLKRKYEILLLSGDNNSENAALADLNFSKNEMHFNQSPVEKRRHISELQQHGKKVLMIGDGLNDAGALLQSDFGVSVADDINNFSPACDAVMDSKYLAGLPEFIQYSKFATIVVLFSYTISIFYNIAGVSFAVSGNLSPLIAAVIMPLSTVTIIMIAVFGTKYGARKLHFKS